MRFLTLSLLVLLSLSANGYTDKMNQRSSNFLKKVSKDWSMEKNPFTTRILSSEISMISSADLGNYSNNDEYRNISDFLSTTFFNGPRFSGYTAGRWGRVRSEFTCFGHKIYWLYENADNKNHVGYLISISYKGSESSEREFGGFVVYDLKLNPINYKIKKYDNFNPTPSYTPWIRKASKNDDKTLHQVSRFPKSEEDLKLFMDMSQSTVYRVINEHILANNSEQLGILIEAYSNYVTYNMCDFFMNSVNYYSAYKLAKLYSNEQTQKVLGRYLNKCTDKEIYLSRNNNGEND